MLRRGRLIVGGLAALVVVLAAFGVESPWARSVAIVGNLRDGTVTVADQRPWRALGKINVIPDGSIPRDPSQAAIYPSLVKLRGVNYVQGLALSPNGRTLYVSRGYLGDVAAFDVASRRLLWRLQISGVRADHVALSADGRRLFVSALTANVVEVIATASHRFVGSFPTGDWAHVLEFTPGARLIVNGSLGNQLLPRGTATRDWLTFADPRTLRVRRILRFGAGVRPFVFSPDGSRAYVQFSFLNGFKVINTRTGRVIHVVRLPARGPAVGLDPSRYPNQAAHHGIALSGDHATICDAATVSNYVALVSRRSLFTRAIIRVGDQPADAQTSADGRFCLVANRGSGRGGNTLSVISYRLRRQVARLRMGRGPQETIVGDIPDNVLRRAGFLPNRPR